MSNEKSEIGLLIDGTPENFQEHCKDKDLGYVSSLKNHLAGTYEVMTQIKNDLVNKIKEEGLSKDSEECKTLQGLYAEMLKVEEKATLCHNLITERSLKC